MSLLRSRHCLEQVSSFYIWFMIPRNPRSPILTDSASHHLHYWLTDPDSCYKCGGDTKQYKIKMRLCFKFSKIWYMHGRTQPTPQFTLYSTVTHQILKKAKGLMNMIHDPSSHQPSRNLLVWTAGTQKPRLPSPRLHLHPPFFTYHITFNVFSLFWNEEFCFKFKY